MRDTAIAIESFNRLVPLTSEEREQLTSLLQDRTKVNSRDKLIEVGRPRANLLFILSGWVAECRRLAGGKRQVLYFGLPGEVLAAQYLFYPNALLSVEALSSCVVATIDVALMSNKGPLHSKLRTALFLGAIRRNAILQEWMTSIGRRTGFQRVAVLLMELAVRLRLRGLSSGEKHYFPLRQRDIADATGLTSPYVNQILRKMREAGFLDIINGCFVIKSEEELAKAAAFEPDYLNFPRNEDLLAYWAHQYSPIADEPRTSTAD